METPGRKLPHSAEPLLNAQLGLGRECALFCQERKIVFKAFPFSLRIGGTASSMVAALAEVQTQLLRRLCSLWRERSGCCREPKLRDAKHMRQNLESAGLELSKDAVQAIQALAVP